MTKKIIVIGGGGHTGVLIQLIKEQGQHKIEGIIDSDPKKTAQTIFGVPVLGGDSLLSDFDSSFHFIIGVGSTGDNTLRKKLYLDCVKQGLQPLTVIHQTSQITGNAKIGSGAQILAGAIIGNNTHIGENVIINTGVIVDHDCKISSHTHIASGACLAGNIEVQEGAFIGCGATIINDIKIGQRALIGAGSVVIKDIPAESRVAGNPAKNI